MKKTLLTLLFAAFSLSANAYDTYNVDGQGYNYTFNFYDKGENFGVEINKEIIPISSDNVYNKYHEPIFASAVNWSKVITGNSTSPVTYSILGLDAVDPDNNYNAMAESLYANVAESPYKVTFVNARINGYTVTSSPNREDFPTDGIILVGLGVDPVHPGWGQFTGFHPLYHGELPDFNSVITHEIMHSLGVTNYAGQFFKEQGDENFYFSKGAEDLLGIWDKNLRIYTGDMTATFDTSKEVIPQRGMIIGKNKAFDVYTYSPYFVGEETLKVLAGKDNPDEAKAAIIANGGFVNYSTYYDSDNKRPKVYGLPIHPSDGGKNPEPELSHLELHNSYMSHQSYRNWLIPMEAELAVLKDLGYNIPLRKFFGKSYYLNYSNTSRKVENFTSGYSEWDGSSYIGAPSTVTQGVGLHVYGNNYEINQLSDILSNGEGAIGARIEGSDNIYNLKSGHKIQTNGKENLGLAVTWGQNHEVNIENGAAVTANGENGIATSFDFGGNLFGAYQDAKGSYINYSAEFKYNMEPDIDIQHALVNEFNVAGTLTGSKAAIYISDNAHVKEINILNGAQINGDIISEWNSIKSGVNAKVQWFDGDRWNNADPEDESQRYFTNLNFNASTGVDVNGNITGDNEVYNTLKMKNATGSIVNFNGEKINVNSLDNKGDINISQKATIVTVNNSIIGNGSLNVLSGASLSLASNISAVENSVSLNSASFDVANNSVGSTTFSKLTLTGANKMNVDADIATQTSDTLKFNNSADLIVNPGASLEISNVNLMNANKAYTNKRYYIPFISATDNNQNLLGSVSFAGRNNILTPIFKYNLGYTEDDTSGGFLLSRGATKSYGSYNPAVVDSPVAAQFGGYLTQLNSYEHAFHNMDMRMLMTRKERQAYKMANRYASTVTPTVFSPTYLPENDKGAWFRPYATFEKVDLKNGPKVENISYGSYFGGDSPLYELKRGWDYQYSVYAGYNGSHQNYSGNSIYQNGGILGATAIWYKNDFFTALTANVGAGVADASTMYGSEDFPMLMTGIASKTGYNWELGGKCKGKFIIQPSFMMSYSFVNTFDYTNAAGVRIKSEPLNAINIAPGLKFIGNLKNGWQPYIGMQMVWNIMDKTDFRANNVALPDMSVKPYFQYGIGIQKRWGDRFTGFFQTMIRNGGRNGVALSFGFRWSLGGGKGKKADEHRIQKSLKKTPVLKKTEITLNDSNA